MGSRAIAGGLSTDHQLPGVPELRQEPFDKLINTATGTLPEVVTQQCLKALLSTQLLPLGHSVTAYRSSQAYYLLSQLLSQTKYIIKKHKVPPGTVRWPLSGGGASEPAGWLGHLAGWSAAWAATTAPGWLAVLPGSLDGVVGLGWPGWLRPAASGWPSPSMSVSQPTASSRASQPPSHPASHPATQPPSQYSQASYLPACHRGRQPALQGCA